MGYVGWDDHNRSNRFHSVDQARNTLMSCAPNAILFTGGDNDTFPLWYVQNVEGFRTDVPVAVLSYFSTDWYLEQMKMQQYKSEPLPLSISGENYRSGRNDYVPLVENPKAQAGVNIDTYIKLVDSNDPRVYVQLRGGGSTSKLLSRNFVLNVDKQAVIENEVVPADKHSRIVDKMVWELDPRNGAIYKNELALLDLLANNNWERPIYFNNTSANTLNMNLRPYLHLEGMAYRLLPVEARANPATGEVGEVNIPVMKENVKKFLFRGLDNPDTYNDEEYRKFGTNTRYNIYRLADALAKEGKRTEALSYLDMALEKIPDEVIPYSFFMPNFVELYQQLGEDERAQELADLLADRAVNTIEYSLKTDQGSDMASRSMLTLQRLALVYRDALDASMPGAGLLPETEMQPTTERQAMLQEKAQKYMQLYYDYRQLLNPQYGR